MAKLPFRPVIGTDAQIQRSDPSEGFVWFATDSKKIYYSDGNAFLSMGGNSNIFYGVMELEDTPDEGQTEFTFTVFDIDGNDEVEDGNYAIPNIDDLILNKDGCFYRVSDIDGIGADAIIYTKKLTLAGSGSSDGPSTGKVGSIEFKRITNTNVTCLYKQNFDLEFQVTAVDSDGEMTGDGTYTVAINKKPNIITGSVKNGDKTSIPLGEFLSLGDNEVRVSYTMDIGGSGLTTESKTWKITTTQVDLTWEYSENTLNSTNNPFTLNWTVSGLGIEKTTHILIDDNYIVPSITQKTNDFSLTISDLLAYNLTHGAHKFQMWATFELNGYTIPTPTITKNVIFYTVGNNTPIISCNFFEDTVTQYNTVEIPIIFYQYENTGTLEAKLYENGGDPIDTWTNIVNGEVKKWYYTPLESTTRNLTISCGTAEKTLILEVKPLNIDNKEIENYAFRFKASDFASNTAVQNWAKDSAKATFSNNFDWINGGIESELDEKGNVRQFFRVKAGSKMIINYKMFANPAPLDGKTFKFIFRASNCRDYDALVLNCYDDENHIGLKMQAQEALIEGSENKIRIPYCEESYIEFEYDITKTDSVKKYLTSWLDGVPSVFVRYGSNETFTNDKYIEIGSPDCDVCLYMIKLYERHLTDDQHLSNFIADASNAQEMLDRYNRNDIVDKERSSFGGRSVISPSKLAEKNPDCRVHVYDVEHMVKEIDVVVPNCSYTQYHGSKNPVLFADGVDIKIQGTSSASYGISAFNIDSDFTQGFTDVEGNTIDKWSMNPNSIPVNYFTTKVNVASAEQANNALNADWYNKFQPYKSRWREKEARARDCMEFTPGVLFLKDNNTQKDFTDKNNFISNNVFAEIPNYIDDPYARMYSICNMGNSKKNTEVFHDQTNLLEYCIEVADNQKATQWMTNNIYDDSHWSVEKPDWEFRYPKLKKLSTEGTSFISPLTNQQVSHRQHAFDSWRRFLNWMATSNPQPKYKKIIINSAEEFEAASIIRSPQGEGKPDIITHVDLYIAPQDENGNLTGVHTLIEEYDSSIDIYYTMTTNLYGYTMEPLPEPKTYGVFEFQNERYSKTLLGSKVTEYAGEYKYDTYEYRMAKMLSECEDFLVMDSVLFHYLFIERHTMIDNVAKNTFWTTEDGFHWDLTKNYDNDTSDGNDNQGKLTLTYGIEPFDSLPDNENDFYFNANQSVWFRFCGGLYEACRTLHKALLSAGPNRNESAWDSKAYLKKFRDWQKTIPERCWIEDYYRKYVRPWELYSEPMYIDMLEGGQKTHQRQQFETYQDYYISSKYAADTESRIIIRSTGTDKLVYSVPVSVYADCYIQAAYGSGNVPNVSMRVKRNEVIPVSAPSDIEVMDNSTIYWFSPHLFQTIGEIGGTDLSIYVPDQISVASATKLRTLAFGQYGSPIQNNVLKSIGFENNAMLEELHAANCPAATITLNLENAVNLKKVDLRNSGFTSVSIAKGAPLNSMQVCKPGTIQLSDLRNLQTFGIQEPDQVVRILIDNIDNNTVNSKTDILDECLNINSYTLRNVKWTINNADEIVNNKILVLDRVFEKMTPFTPQSQREPETSETSLTGTLTITSNAYNSNDALQIYDYYSTQIVREDKDDEGNVVKQYRRFPKLDINFEGENAQLYKITIMKDESNIIWTRKLRPGDSVDNTFLSAGPNGAFNVNDIKKSSTDYHDFAFSGVWNIYDTDTNEYIGKIQEPNKLPIKNNVRQNLTFIPEFEASTRKWSVTLKQDNEILATIPDVPAGTILKDVIDTHYPDIPWKDDGLLDDTYLTYSFEGYALSKTATSGLKVENYPVTSNMELYAIFKKVSVYDNIHDDYWLYELTSSNAYTILKDDNPDYHIEKGYIVTPNPRKNLRGKITIPATYNNLPVYQISSSSFENNISVTHVFLGTGSKLRVIGSRAFMNSRIKFFEFTDELRRIEERAFMQASLLEPDATNSYVFGNNLYYMGGYAFNQALNFKGSAVTFAIPATLKTMGYYALSNFSHPAVNSSMTIGRPGEGSILDLSAIPGGSSSTDYRRISDATTSLFPSIQFYSKIYHNVDEEVALANFQSKWTVGQMLGNDSGGIGTVEVIHTA